MPLPVAPVDRRLLDGTRRRAARILRIEQGWPAVLPAIGLLLGWLALSLFAVPQRLPHWLHAALLVLLLATVVLLSRRRLAALPSLGEDARDRRIERASGLRHQPLLTLRDRPALAGEGAGAALWDAHLARSVSGLGPLRAGWPRLEVLRHDRYRLSVPLVLALAAGVVAAGRDLPSRVGSGFWPGAETPLGPRPSVQAWISFPSFAPGAPLFLSDPHGQYEVPAGAVLTATVTGASRAPEVAAAGAPPQTRRLGDTSWSTTLALDTTGTVRLQGNGYSLAEWHVTVQPVAAPEVRWTKPPGPAPMPWRTSLPWTVSHRYGVRSLAAELRLAGHAGDKDRVLRIPIPLPGEPRSAHGVEEPDLSADPWAGETVVARLVAADAAGHSARSDEARFTLPARPFHDPLARAVLDVRKRLALGREAPLEAAGDLLALGDTPGKVGTDAGLMLNLSADAALLQVGHDQAGSVDEAVGRLWQLALALEEGAHQDPASALAALDLRAAQERLADQMERMRQLGAKGQAPAEQEELRRRMQALAGAIARRMQALADQAAREHAALPPMPDASVMSGQDLAKMLQRMQDAANSGHPEDAMRQLQQMQSMLDRMRQATPRDLQALQRQAQARAAAQDQMRAVQDLVHRQSALLDHAQARQNRQLQRRADQSDGGLQEDSGAMDPATRALLEQLGLGTPPRPNAPGRPGTPAPAGQPQQAQGQNKTDDPAADEAGRRTDRQAQRGLRRALDELDSEFKELTGKDASAFKDAGAAMQDAREALVRKDDPGTQAAQTKALEALQKGAQQMRQAMSGGGSGSGAGGGMALLPSSGAGGESGNRPGEGDSDEADGNGQSDPLGRHMGNGEGSAQDGGDTHVPDTVERARARDIEQELRRRDSDRTRPPSELDYLDRLLKPF